MAKVKIFIEPNALQFAAKRIIGPTIKRELTRSGKEMVDEANRLMASRFNLNRPYERRRYPGSRRAATALDFSVTGDDTQFRLSYRVLGGDVVLKRILGMNFGTGNGHPIVPSGKWALKGANLSTRAAPTKAQKGAGRGGRGYLWFPVPEGGPYVRASKVNHPGSQKGKGFLEEARDNAAKNFRMRISA